MDENTKDKSEKAGASGPERTGGATQKSRVIDPKVIEERIRQRRRRRIIFFAAVAAVIIVAVLLALHFTGIFDRLGKRGDDGMLVSAAIRVEYTPKGTHRLGSSGDCLIISDGNGITGIDRDGKWKWNSTLSASNPAFSGHGDVLLVTDQSGKSIWAFDGSGFRWRYISEMPLICSFVSPSGSELAVVTEQENFESAVTFLNVKKDVHSERFTRRFGTYRMLAAAVSGDAAQLAASGVYYSGGSLSGTTVFMRVSDGEVYSSILTDNSVYLQLRYLDDGTLFAANSDSLRLVRKLPKVSGGDDTDREIWSRNGARTMVVDTGVVGGDLCAVAMTEANSSSGGVSSVVFYDRSGKETASLGITDSIIGMETRGNRAAVFSSDTVYLISRSGKLIGQHKLDSAISSIVFAGSGVLAADTADGIYLIEFTESR